MNFFSNQHGMLHLNIVFELIVADFSERWKKLAELLSGLHLRLVADDGSHCGGKHLDAHFPGIPSVLIHQ